jgi:Tfp pilus assembly protein PilF
LFRYLVVAGGILTLVGCSTSSSNLQQSQSNINVPNSANIKLSHVNAYLLLGNINQAQKIFDTINNPFDMPNTLLTLAELRAVSGDAEGAQKAFLLALENDSLDKTSVSITLIDYFCTEKKWPALEGYASTLLPSSADDNTSSSTPSSLKLKNNALTKVGLCFFNEQHLEQAQKWLQQLDVTQQLDPQVHLALARIAVEQNQLAAAQELINQYEATKTAIDAKMLWTTFEVYQALNQSETAEQTGENLYSLFPNNEYTRKYILTKKRGQRIKLKQQETVALLETINSSPEKNLTTPTPPPAYEQSIHIMKKGETLYQLSKRYDVLIADLLRWNPDLVANNIPLGAKIRLFAD